MWTQDGGPALVADQKERRLTHYHEELQELMFGSREADDFAKGVIRVRKAPPATKVHTNRMTVFLLSLILKRTLCSYL